MYCLPAADLNKCYNTGDRCMGAANFPYIQYRKCCKDTDECATDLSLGWGSFCKPKNAKDAGAGPATSCYNTGERCKGASGFPYVPYHNCCQPSDQCEESPSRGWGSFCVPSDNSSAVSTMSASNGTSVMGATSAGENGSSSPMMNYSDAAGVANAMANAQSTYNNSNSNVAPAGAQYQPTSGAESSPRGSYPSYGNINLSDTEAAGSPYNYEDPQKSYGGEQTSAGAATTACPGTVPGHSVTASPGPSSGTTASATPTSTLPPRSPFCAAQQDDVIALGRLLLIASVNPAIPGRANDIDIRITRTPCGETNLTARSLKLGDAMVLESTVCAEAAKVASVSPTECMTNTIADGSILVGISIIFPEGTTFNFADFAAFLNQLLPGRLRITVDVTVRFPETSTTTTPVSTTTMATTFLNSSTTLLSSTTVAPQFATSQPTAPAPAQSTTVAALTTVPRGSSPSMSINPTGTSTPSVSVTAVTVSSTPVVAKTDATSSATPSSPATVAISATTASSKTPASTTSEQVGPTATATTLETLSTFTVVQTSTRQESPVTNTNPAPTSGSVTSSTISTVQTSTSGANTVQTSTSGANTVQTSTSGASTVQTST
jgi:hypothetical protein